MAKTKHDSETPAEGQQAITVCAFIYHMFDNELKVFLPRRADSKKFLPGYLELPGGHVDFGESLENALQRELREEFNMAASIGEPFAAFTYLNEIKGAHVVEVVYFAQFTQPLEKITLDPADHQSFEWLTKGEVIKHRQEIEAQHASIKLESGSDPEYLAILKGFELLEN